MVTIKFNLFFDLCQDVQHRVEVVDLGLFLPHHLQGANSSEMDLKQTDSPH